MTKEQPTKQRPKKAKKKAANQYDNDGYNYLKYWQGRDYENAAEEMAIKRLLRGKKFGQAADIGGGYGRLCVLLEKYAAKVTLAEPSKTQLDMAEEFLKGRQKIDKKLMQADNLKFKDGSLDLVTMIRVMHHLPDPGKELSEVHRVLSDDGYFVLELANYAHARNRLKHLLKRKPLPAKPVDIRSEQNKREEEIAFVNHNPKTVVAQLDKTGFEVVRILSVSNLRSPGLKKILPKPIMLSAERIMQSPFSRIYFGPAFSFCSKRNSLYIF
jgi:ubiquinone/menaquinone biosynthesis C-methylase UbiE